MAITLVSRGTNGAANTASGTIAVSASSGNLLVLTALNINPDARTIVSVTDTSGLSWQKRIAFAWGDSGNPDLEVWWASFSGTLNSTVTVELSGVAQALGLTISVWSGIPIPSAPWDPNSSLPAMVSHANVVAGITTSSIAPVLVAFAGEVSGDYHVATPPLMQDWVAIWKGLAVSIDCMRGGVDITGTVFADSGQVSIQLEAALANATIGPFMLGAFPSGHNGLIVDAFANNNSPLIAPTPPATAPQPKPSAPKNSSTGTPVPQTNSNSVNVGIPAANIPYVNAQGLPTVQFYNFLVALWQRGGGAIGVSSRELNNTVANISTTVQQTVDNSLLALLANGDGEFGRDLGTGVSEADLMLSRDTPAQGPSGYTAELLSLSPSLDLVPPAVTISSLLLGAQLPADLIDAIQASMLMLLQQERTVTIEQLTVGMLLASAAAAPPAAAGTGTGALSLPASETLSAGALVNIFNNSGVANVQNANATDGAKPAQAFALHGAMAGDLVGLGLVGQLNSNLGGLTPGISYFLDTSPGGVTLTPPTATGNLIQNIGQSISSTTVLFMPQSGVQL